MGRAMVDLYCESFHKIPKRITLDIDDTFDAVHGGQQLRLFNAHYDEYGFQPIVVFDGGGRFITAVLLPAKRPSCKEFAARRSKPFCVDCCGRFAPTGPRAKFCCAAIAIIVVPRFSIGRQQAQTEKVSRCRPRARHNRQSAAQCGLANFAYGALLEAPLGLTTACLTLKRGEGEEGP